MKSLKELSKPFEPCDIEWFVGVTMQDKSRGMAIPFITNRAVQDRLDEVCGVDGWKNEFKTLKDTDIIEKDGTIKGKKFSYLCGISVWSDKHQAWITKWDGAEDTDVESLKGGLSSAMKRAAVQFGIGRYLYKMESPWVEIEKKGNSYVIKAGQEFVLPAWALPGGSGNPGPGDEKKVFIRTGAQSNHQSNQSNNQVTKLSEKQINRALAKATASGRGLDDINLWIEKKFGVKEIKDLNRQQYDELCDALDRAR